MTYAYDLTFPDFVAAQRLHIRHQPRARLWFLVWQRIMPVVSLLSIILLVRDVAFHHFSYPPIVGGILAALSWIGLFTFLFRPIQLRLAFRKLRPDVTNGRHAVELELTPEELISRIPGKSEGRFRRAAIIDFAEDEHLALLYLRPKLFLYIPKSAMPEPAWTELRQWLDRS